MMLMTPPLLAELLLYVTELGVAMGIAWASSLVRTGTAEFEAC